MDFKFIYIYFVKSYLLCKIPKILSDMFRLSIIQFSFVILSWIFLSVIISGHKINYFVGVSK